MLRKRLLEIGVLKSARVAIVGTGQFASEILMLFADYQGQVIHYSKESLDLELENVKHLTLIDQTSRNRWSHLEGLQYIIVLSCSQALLKEILFAADPYCQILIIGPIDGIFDKIDFYSTVHRKNLELVFI